MSPATKKDPENSLEVAKLRRRAEAHHSQSHAKEDRPRMEVDTQQLIHVLQVHQIELEMQNEELRLARAEGEAGLGRYTDLYGFTPVGYPTLGGDWTVGQVNLCGALS
jgi:hypothetical protein